MLGKCFQQEIPDAILCAHVGDGPDSAKAATLTIDGVLASGNRDIAASATAPLSDGGTHQLQPVCWHARVFLQAQLADTVVRIWTCALGSRPICRMPPVWWHPGPRVVLTYEPASTH